MKNNFNEIHYIKIDDKSLYQLFLANERYAFTRDNGLASFTIINHIKTHLPKMREDFRVHTSEQLIEEIISHLICPELSGANKHKAQWLNKETNAYRIIYISDYEYKKKELISSVYKFNELIINDDISFEDENDWLDLISFLSKYTSINYVPYNDKEHKFYKPKSKDSIS